MANQRRKQENINKRQGKGTVRVLSVSVLFVLMVVTLTIALTACAFDEEGNTCNHTRVLDQSVSATCTSTGLTAGSHCSKCGVVIVAQQEIAPLGHEIIDTEEVPATCVQNGLAGGKHCSVCKEVIEEQIVIDALGHEMECVKAKDPTCTEIGW